MAPGDNKNNRSDLPQYDKLVPHIVFWAILALIGWIFTTVLDHDRELSRRGPRINALEKKTDNMEQSWLYYKERFFAK